MRLTLVRHGECLGQSDPMFWNDPDTPLSEFGKRQAVAVAQQLATEHVSQIISSPLLRALGSAESIRAACGLSQFQVWTELREGYSGQYTGWSRNRILTQFPHAVLPDHIGEVGWQHSDVNYAALWARCEAVVAHVQEQYRHDDHVVLVTHGGCANYLLHVLLGLAPKEPRWFELDNGSISRLRVVPDPKAERPDWPLYPPIPVEIHTLNDTKHLAAMNSDA